MGKTRNADGTYDGQGSGHTFWGKNFGFGCERTRLENDAVARPRCRLRRDVHDMYGAQALSGTPATASTATLMVDAPAT